MGKERPEPLHQYSTQVRCGVFQSRRSPLKEGHLVIACLDPLLIDSPNLRARMWANGISAAAINSELEEKDILSVMNIGLWRIRGFDCQLFPLRKGRVNECLGPWESAAINGRNVLQVSSFQFKGKEIRWYFYGAMEPYPELKQHGVLFCSQLKPHSPFEEIAALLESFFTFLDGDRRFSKPGYRIGWVTSRAKKTDSGFCATVMVPPVDRKLWVQVEPYPGTPVQLKPEQLMDC
jgi:hypothetical protein